MLVRYKTNRVILVRVDLVISLFLVGIFWQTNASERKTNKISHALLNPNFCQEVLVTTLYIQSTASHSVLWTVRNKIWQEVAFFFIFRTLFYIITVLASAPLHTQDTEIGLGALVWQPQPSFSISDRSCLMAEKSRQNASRIARQKKMKSLQGSTATSGSCYGAKPGWKLQRTAATKTSCSATSQRVFGITPVSSLNCLSLWIARSTWMWTAAIFLVFVSSSGCKLALALSEWGDVEANTKAT